MGSECDLRGTELSGDHDFERGYFCAVAVLLREQGMTPDVQSLFVQGGDAKHADPDDRAQFEAHGLIESA
ncbi:MAG: hypothetical protein F8N15_10545 [Methanobacterium sp.]|nr:hypothetical protein [Methanobacterium sp.]